MRAFFVILFAVFAAWFIDIMISKKKVFADYDEMLSLSKPNKLLAFLILALMVLIAGLRTTDSINSIPVIGDTYTYSRKFLSLQNNLSGLTEDVNMTNDPGFSLLSILIKSFISNDAQVFVFILSFITLSLTFITLYKYARPFYLGIYFYITWGAYLVSMNGIRQALAASIIFIATGYLLEEKWWKFIPCVILAGTIHASALIFIPIYFIVRQKAWSVKFNSIILLSILIFIFFENVTPIFFELLARTKYNVYIEKFDSDPDAGVNIIRVILATVPVIMAYFARKRLAQMCKYSGILVNLSVLNMVFMLFSLYHWIFARMSIYLNLYNFILLPVLVRAYYRDAKIRDMVYFLMMILFFVYYYYDLKLMNVVYMSKFIKL